MTNPAATPGSAEPNFGLSGSRVLIAGGTSGVGLETARTFLRAGAASLVIGGRDSGRGASAERELRELSPGANVLFVSADVNTIEGAEQLVGEAVTAMDGIDVLVNSTVAPYMPVLLHDMTLQDLRDVMVRQSIGCLLVTRAAIDVMRDAMSGSIINIASDAMRVPTPGETGIGAAMAAIVTFSQTLALEAKRYGVRVNVLSPSLIVDTGSYDRAMAAEFSQKIFEKIVSQAHLGLTEPQDLANAIVFLASDLSRRITGQVISVNGGISIAS